ncbi:MAG: helix-turn-helix transcriptional regulator [Oscillospiraceae bacterium]|nr:helix-turn-helix transcriptional regulator [Oscillospiraceae bacterium]
MNSNLLKAEMVKNGDTQTKLAEALGMTTSCLNQRINGSVDFRKNEINEIRKRYHLTAEQTIEIFFAA